MDNAGAEGEDSDQMDGQAGGAIVVDGIEFCD